MIQVPQIKGIKVNQVLEEAQDRINIDEDMTDFHDAKLSIKDYVVNVDKKPNN